MTAPGGFVAGDVLGAADLNALPGGVKGYALKTASSYTLTTTVADVPDLTVTFTAVSSRLYRTTVFIGHVNINDTGVARVVYLSINNGGNTQITQARYSDETYSGSLTCSVIETGLSGSTTRKARAYSSGVEANIPALTVSSTMPAYILVEDIGPA